MSSRFLQAFRDVDIDLILERLDVKENETTRFCLLHRGEDVFFQLCRDRKIKLNVYMEFEREMLRLA